MKISKDVVIYIFKLLCADNSIDVDNIFAYCKENEIPTGKKIIIIQSHFFDIDKYGKKEFLPVLPLNEINGIPLLFGDDRMHRKDGQIIIWADLIASTFFLISRYEEIVCCDVRDQHGRFPGKESLPYNAGFIDRPIVDEYGGLLRKLMRELGINVSEPPAGFNNIYLTHDVDIPWEHFTGFTAVKRVLGILKRENRFDLYPIKNYLGNPTKDPIYTFNNIIDADATIQNSQIIYFIKSGGTKLPEDQFIYIKTKAYKHLMKTLEESGAILGYHVSYEAGMHPEVICSEINLLNKMLNQTVCYSRNHYLSSREPSDFYYLIRSGITDDFSMGYADVAGFRLGTSRSVRWIDPENITLTQLILHPLTIMDDTLTAPQYMNLEKQAAQSYGKSLLDTTYMYNGDVTLLWHNNKDIGNEESDDWINYLYFLNYLKDLNK